MASLSASTLKGSDTFYETRSLTRSAFSQTPLPRRMDHRVNACCERDRVTWLDPKNKRKPPDVGVLT